MANKRRTQANRDSARPGVEGDVGWEEFEARLRTLQTCLEPDQGDYREFDVEECLQNALKNKYKNRPVTGNLLHYAIDIDADLWHEAVKAGSLYEVDNVALVLEARAQVDAWMSFEAFGKEGRVMPIHLAATRGLIPAIRLLVEHTADVNQKSLHAGEPNFCAIHDAAFAGNTDAVQVLLELEADPNVRNKDGHLPVHTAARTGADKVAELLVEAKARLDRELPNQARSTPITIGVKNRMFPKERLHVLAPFCYEDYEVNFFNDMLQICTENVPAAKALITSILGDGTQQASNAAATKRRDRVVKAVKDGCKKGVSPIPSLTEIIKLAPEVAAAILDIFLLKPVEKAPFHWPLPKVANLSEENMMTTTYCSDTEWKYDSTKLEFEKQVPRWHVLFAPAPQSNEDDCEVQVKYLSFPNLLDVRVLHALNAARDKRIFATITIQAVIRSSWPVVSIAVRMGIACECVCSLIFAWWSYVTLPFLPVTIHVDPAQCKSVPGFEATSRVYSSYYSTSRPHMRVQSYAGITTLAPQESTMTMVGSFHHYAAMRAMSVLWALALREAFNHCYFALMHRAWGFSSMQVINNNFFDMAATALLLSFLYCYETRGGNDVAVFLFCLNVVARAMKLLWQFCLAQGVGEQILPIVSSFVPMRKFFIFAFIMNITFFLAFSSLRKKEDDLYHVFEMLFFAMWSGDGNSYGGLRGLDSDGHLSLFLLMFVTVSFTVCTLNLMIAIFSKVYKDNASEATLLFLQHRCRRTEQLLLSPVWKYECKILNDFFSSEPDPDATVEEVMEEQVHDPQQGRDLLPYVLSGVCFVIWLGLAVGTRPNCTSIWLAMLLAAALILLQAAVMQNIWFNRDYYKHKLHALNQAAASDHADGNAVLNLLQGSSRDMQFRALTMDQLDSNLLFDYEDDFFVWICHRADFDSRQCGSKRGELREMLSKLNSNVQRLSQHVADCDAKLDKLTLRMDDAFPKPKRVSGHGFQSFAAKQRTLANFGDGRSEHRQHTGSKSRPNSEARNTSKSRASASQYVSSSPVHSSAASPFSMVSSLVLAEPQSVNDSFSLKPDGEERMQQQVAADSPHPPGFPETKLNELEMPPARVASPKPKPSSPTIFKKRNR